MPRAASSNASVGAGSSSLCAGRNGPRGSKRPIRGEDVIRGQEILQGEKRRAVELRLVVEAAHRHGEVRCRVMGPLARQTVNLIVARTQQRLGRVIAVRALSIAATSFGTLRRSQLGSRKLKSQASPAPISVSSMRFVENGLGFRRQKMQRQKRGEDGSRQRRDTVRHGGEGMRRTHCYRVGRNSQPCGITCTNPASHRCSRAAYR